VSGHEGYVLKQTSLVALHDCILRQRHLGPPHFQVEARAKTSPSPGFDTRAPVRPLLGWHRCRHDVRWRQGVWTWQVEWRTYRTYRLRLGHAVSILLSMSRDALLTTSHNRLSYIFTAGVAWRNLLRTSTTVINGCLDSFGRKKDTNIWQAIALLS
jgi:hypothetical protein